MRSVLFVAAFTGLLAGGFAELAASIGQQPAAGCTGRFGNRVCANDGKIYGNSCELRGNMTSASPSLGLRCKLDATYVPKVGETRCNCTRLLFDRMCRDPESVLAKATGLLGYIYKALIVKQVCLTDNSTKNGVQAVCAMIKDPALGVKCGTGCSDQKCSPTFVSGIGSLRPDDVLL